MYTSKGEEGIISLNKWDKMRNNIGELDVMVKMNLSRQNNTTLMSKRVLLVNFTRTYRVLNPHLKVINLTIDSWCYHIDTEGWKLQG